MIVFIKNPAKVFAMAVLTSNINTRDARYKENEQAMGARASVMWRVVSCFRVIVFTD